MWFFKKIWPGVCPIPEILRFCSRLLKMFEISEISKCRILGKIGQGSALHWCFWFLKFSKCGILRKFDQGSALYLNSQCLNCLITFKMFWNFVLSSFFELERFFLSLYFNSWVSLSIINCCLWERIHKQLNNVWLCVCSVKGLVLGTLNTSEKELGRKIETE